MGVGWLLVSGLGLRLLDYLERPSFKWKENGLFFNFRALVLPRDPDEQHIEYYQRRSVIIMTEAGEGAQGGGISYHYLY